MASLGFCHLLARTPCLLSSLNFCKFNVLYYNVLNGIILYAVGIYNLCSVTPNVRSVTRNGRSVSPNVHSVSRNRDFK